MSKVILYTTHCPACKVLESKLEAKDIKFDIDDDIEHIIELGFQTAPVLSVDGHAMALGEANKWVANQN